MLPESPRERIEWILAESLVLFAVLVFWVVAVGLLVVALTLVAVLLQFLDPELLRPFFQFVARADAAWAALLPLTFASVGLYVFVRAGTLLIDHYRATSYPTGSERGP